MLPPASRLRQRRDFKRVYQRGRSVAVPCFVLHWRKNGSPRTRMGFSVSKKLGNAVKRNRIKRQCRAAARQLLPTLPKGYDLVLVVRAAAAAADYARLKEQMEKAIALMRQKNAEGRK